jgi:hypothetical protein
MAHCNWDYRLGPRLERGAQVEVGGPAVQVSQDGGLGRRAVGVGVGEDLRDQKGLIGIGDLGELAQVGR